MPKFEFTLICTKAVNPENKPWRYVATIEGENSQMVALVGIEDAFRKSLASTTEDNQPIPEDAIKFWKDARGSGNIQVYELLTALEQWGISTTATTAISGAVPKPAQSVSRASPNGKPPSFMEMLQGMLTDYRAQDKALDAEIRELQARQIMVREQIAQMSAGLIAMGMATKPKAKRGRPPKKKETARQEAENGSQT